MLFLKDCILEEAAKLCSLFILSEGTVLGTDEYNTAIDSVIEQLRSIKGSLKRGSDRKFYRKENAKLQGAIQALKFLRNKSEKKMLFQSNQSINEVKGFYVDKKNLKNILRLIKEADYEPMQHASCDNLGISNIVAGWTGEESAASINSLMGNMLGLMGIPASACTLFNDTIGKGMKGAGNLIYANSTHAKLQEKIKEALSEKSAVIKGNLIDNIDGFITSTGAVHSINEYDSLKSALNKLSGYTIYICKDMLSEYVDHVLYEYDDGGGGTIPPKTRNQIRSMPDVLNELHNKIVDPNMMKIVTNLSNLYQRLSVSSLTAGRSFSPADVGSWASKFYPVGSNDIQGAVYEYMGYREVGVKDRQSSAEQSQIAFVGLISQILTRLKEDLDRAANEIDRLVGTSDVSGGLRDVSRQIVLKMDKQSVFSKMKG